MHHASTCVNDGGHQLAEHQTAWQTDANADGRTIATLNSSGTPDYLDLDALGTTRQTVHSGGNASGVARYYPYGEEQSSVTSEYKWTNQQRDPDNTDHFAMRTYSSDLARWLTPDPAGAAAANPEDPQSWNRYTYIENQPVTLSDPLGLAPPCPSGSKPVDPQRLVDFAKNIEAAMHAAGRSPALSGTGYLEPSQEDASTGVPLALDCSGFVGDALAGASGAPVHIDANGAGPSTLPVFWTGRILGGSYGAFSFLKADGPARGELGLLQFPGGDNHVVSGCLERALACDFTAYSLKSGSAALRPAAGTLQPRSARQRRGPVPARAAASA